MSHPALQAGRLWHRRRHCRSIAKARPCLDQLFVDGGPVAQGNHNAAADLFRDSLVNLSTPDVIKSELIHLQRLDSVEIPKDLSP